MRSAATFVALLWLCSVVAYAPAAHAQARDLLTPNGHWHIIASPTHHLGILPARYRPGLSVTTGDSVGMGLDVAGAYGFGNFEVGLLPLRMRLLPDVDLADPAVWLLYGWSVDSTEIGLLALVEVPIEGSGLPVSLGVPLWFDMGSWRLDTGLTLDFNIGDSFSVTPRIPLRYVSNVGSRAFWGFNTGLGIPNLDAVSIPATVLLGMRLGAIEISGQLGWPELLRFNGGSNVNADVLLFQVGIDVIP